MFRCVDGCISLGAWIGLEVWRPLDVGVFFPLRNEREDTALLSLLQVEVPESGPLLRLGEEMSSETQRISAHTWWMAHYPA